mmetsp:Transcript_40257/g.100123  ORF Transcript_40257/g.100123 Transcript_40257/m.100123 type:complete len:318 (+) Transcript_40257:288-1241(+)
MLSTTTRRTCASAAAPRTRRRDGLARAAQRERARSAAAADVRLVERPRIGGREALAHLAERSSVLFEQRAVRVGLDLGVARVHLGLLGARSQVALLLGRRLHPSEPRVASKFARVGGDGGVLDRERHEEVEVERAGGERRHRLRRERCVLRAVDCEEGVAPRDHVIRVEGGSKILPVAAHHERLAAVRLGVLARRVVGALRTRLEIDLQLDILVRDAGARQEVRHVGQRAAPRAHGAKGLCGVVRHGESGRPRDVRLPRRLERLDGAAHAHDLERVEPHLVSVVVFWLQLQGVGKLGGHSRHPGGDRGGRHRNMASN